MSEIRVNTIVSESGSGNVAFNKGINVTGVTTSTSFVGSGANLTNLPAATAITGTPDIAVRNITGVAATFTGVLTYEDVTNVDSVGIVTARGGLEVGAAGVGGTVSALGHVEFVGVTTIGLGLTLGDDIEARFGNAGDLKVYHDGSNSYIANDTGVLNIQGGGANIQLQAVDGESGVIVKADDAVEIYFNGSKKFETHNTGIRVTGIATVTSTIYVNTNGSSIAENNLNFASSGKAYIDHRTTSQDIDFRVSHGSALDRTAITIGSAGVSTFYDTPHDDLGYMRNVPLNTQASTYTLVAADSGKTILASDTITIADGVFSAGDVVTIINNTNGNITINKGSVLYWTADGTSANRTLATRGMASIYFTHNTTAYIGGAGLS